MRNTSFLGTERTCNSTRPPPSDRGVQAAVERGSLCCPYSSARVWEWNEVPSYFRNPVDDFSSSIRPPSTQGQSHTPESLEICPSPSTKSSLIETELLVPRLGGNHLVAFIFWVKKDSDSSSHSVKHSSLSLPLPEFSWHPIYLSFFSVKQGDFINVGREWCQATGSYLSMNVGLNFRT